MAYQALYRQWRPGTFSDMVGQEAIVRTLRNQVASGRIAHAYLFCGSRGTGKTSTAKIMARAVNCIDPNEGDPCGVCAVCQNLKEETSLDVVEIDAASNNGVDEIRDLREKVKYPPQTGRFKVYIIDEVHMLTGAAFNALLKTLEEPPAHVVFILATTEPQKLPATVLSRCQRFDFGRIPAQQIAGRLREAVNKAGTDATDGALALIARAAEGGMRDALSILDMCMGYGSQVTEELVRGVLGTADKPFLFTFADALSQGDVRKTMQLVDELMRAGREPQVFAKDMAYHIRALLMAVSCGAEVVSLLEITPEDAAAYVKQAEGFTPNKLLRLLDLFMKVETEIKWASSPRIALESAAVKACLPANDNSVDELMERVAELEKKVQNGVIASPAATAAPKQAAPVAKPAPTQSPKVSAPQMMQTPDGTGMPPKKIWDMMLQNLKKTDVSLFSQLAACAFGGIKDNTYRAVVPKTNPFAIRYLNQDGRKAAIAAALQDVSGAPVQFEAVMAEQNDPKQEQREKSLVQELINDFGRDKVQIEEE